MDDNKPGQAAVQFSKIASNLNAINNNNNLLTLIEAAKFDILIIHDMKNGNPK